MGKPNLILVGLPGVGKSTVGRKVAERFWRPFLDFDVEIERREGMSVARIFAERGERYFRDRERALTEELLGSGGMVLAPGGGWVATPGNVALLRPPGRIIYLEATPELALRRLRAGTSGRAARPLLARSDPLPTLQRLLAERGEFYRAADCVVNTEVLNLQQVTDAVVELASVFWGE